ncbi:MAG: EAL domain-containing protein [Clostridia bacterium]|nr:EAL domain-containing protein [Clostridia bacterium]
MGNKAGGSRVDDGAMPCTGVSMNRYYQQRKKVFVMIPPEMRMAYENSPLSFVYYQNVDGKAVPVLVSEGFCRNAGVERSRAMKWLEAGMFERMHPDDVGVVSKVSDDFLNQRGPYDIMFRCWLGEQYQLIHGFGKWQAMPDGSEYAVIGYVNITQTKEGMFTVQEAYGLFQEDRFYTDSLTGLPNINYLHEFASEKVNVILTEGKTPVVVYADMAAMQSYNNQYGFREGNELLRLVAATLKAQFPEALVARGADDHFIVIASLSDRDALTERLDEANRRIRQSARGNTSGFLAGICVLNDGDAVIEGIDHAKHALKRLSDDMSRTYAFFSQADDDLYWRNRYIIENFDRALEQGWIKVYYQGLYRIETQKIAAFEALARWVDPVRGIISPGAFIPVLQRYHQLYKLDLYMLEQVCREIPIRHDNGLPLLPVSVNFSRQDFDHADIVTAMNGLYEKYALAKYVDKDYFIVEITEQDMALGAEGFRKQLKQIRENGYRLWLDDFGSGYSAINMFSQFKFDLIKYDMELLRHLDDNDGVNRLILKELVYVAKRMGIHTLIEGLETEAQLAFIREIGCELAQGFYFYRPESLDEILFRIHGGQKIKPCETEEERRALNQRWFE